MDIITKNTEKDVRQELNLLRSFMIGIAGRDEEGSYRPEFVKKILKIVRKKEKFNFKDGKSFLLHLRQNQ